MNQIIFLVIAAVLAIAATVLAFIFIVPEKRREKMNAFGRFLQDLCSFKFLVVEKILQALYIFSTAFIVLYGVMQLFNIQRDYWSGGVKWMGGMGLLYIVLGPIVVRLSYELLMMVVLLVKNVIAINHKLADQTGRAAGDVFATPDVQELKVAVLQRKTQAPGTGAGAGGMGPGAVSHAGADASPGAVSHAGANAGPGAASHAGADASPGTTRPFLQRVRRQIGKWRLPPLRHSCPAVKCPIQKDAVRLSTGRHLYFIEAHLPVHPAAPCSPPSWRSGWSPCCPRSCSYSPPAASSSPWRQQVPRSRSQ